MKTSFIPTFCGITLAAMSAAGVSHYNTVRQFVAVFESSPSAVGDALTNNAPPSPVTLKPVVTAAGDGVKTPGPASQYSTAPEQKEFFESLITRLENLQNQNRDLLDQLAETNRDLMKLEFRVDTHSESFRPLPVSEPLQDASFEDMTDVLPPRTEPIFPSTYE